MLSIANIAKAALQEFHVIRRPDGETALALKDTTHAPEWLKDMIYAAHNNGELPPDDFRYEVIIAVLESLLDDPDGALPYEPTEFADRFACERDIDDLCVWLSSWAGRESYVNECLGEFGNPNSVRDLLLWGMMAEVEEIYNIVSSALDARYEELEAENA